MKLLRAFAIYVDEYFLPHDTHLTPRDHCFLDLVYVFIPARQPYQSGYATIPHGTWVAVRPSTVIDLIARYHYLSNLTEVFVTKDTMHSNHLIAYNAYRRASIHPEPYQRGTIPTETTCLQYRPRAIQCKAHSILTLLTEEFYVDVRIDLFQDSLFRYAINTNNTCAYI
jgi:hypothetical protein